MTRLEERTTMFRTPSALSRNLHTQIAERIGTSIIRGEIAPGEPLPSEMRICDMLAVSRTAVREAIRILTGKGLVESRAKSGTRVRAPELWHYFDPDVLRWQLSGTDIDTFLAKLFSLRMALEPSAAALAAGAANADAKSRLRAAWEAMACAESSEAYVTADIAFHVTIYTATGNEFFWSVAQMFEVALRRSFTLAAPGEHRPRSLAEHRAVMEAISACDAAGAREATAVLMQHSANDIVRILGHNPFAGE